MLASTFSDTKVRSGLVKYLYVGALLHISGYFYKITKSWLNHLGCWYEIESSFSPSVFLKGTEYLREVNYHQRSRTYPAVANGKTNSDSIINSVRHKVAWPSETWDKNKEYKYSLNSVNINKITIPAVTFPADCSFLEHQSFSSFSENLIFFIYRYTCCVSCW